MFKGLDKLDQSIGLNSLEANLLPAIQEMAEEKNWRTRLQLVEVIPSIAKQLGKAFFEEKLVKFYLEWMEDNIYAIREKAVGILGELINIIGEDFFK